MGTDSRVGQSLFVQTTHSPAILSGHARPEWLLFGFIGFYAASAIAVLAIGLRPVIPFGLALGILFLGLPFAIIFEHYGGLKLPFFTAFAVIPVAIWAHNKTLWFVWAAVALLILALPGARKRPKEWKLFGIGMASMAFGYASVWNLNCLLAWHIPPSAAHDPALKSFDIWFYSLFAGRQVSYTGLFPLIHSNTVVRLFDNAYVLLFSEIVLLLFLECQSSRAQRLYRFLLTLFSMYVVGIVCFLIYPAIQPTAYFPESLELSRAIGTTAEFSAGIMKDYISAASGGTLEGYLYFIAIPSLHVMVAIFLQARLRLHRTLFKLFLPINFIVVVSTLVLGYHYVLDVVIAAVFMAIAPLVWRAKEAFSEHRV